MRWFFDILNWIWCIIKSAFYWILENLLTILDYIAQFVLMILPDSPFQFEPIEWGPLGNSIGYFIPVQKILEHFIIILTAIALYMGVRYLLRLIRQVE